METEDTSMAENPYENFNRTGYVQPLTPETKYTSRKVQVDGITLYDSDAAFRRNFLKKHRHRAADPQVARVALPLHPHELSRGAD